MKTLISLLLFVGVAQGQSPIIASYRDFSGGLNNNDASVSIAANESPDLMNVAIDEPIGALTQRNGYLTCGNTPSGNTATNLYEYSKNNGSRALIVTDSISVWQTFDCITYSTITTGLSSLALPRFATILDKLWIVNGSTSPIVWDGTTASWLDGSGTLPDVPTGKYITYWKSRVWIANTATAPSSVYFTDLVDDDGNILDPATSSMSWISTNQIYFNRDDGSPIYGMKVYRDNMYVFKETGISRLVFEDEYNLNVVKNVSAIGSKFQESIVEMDDGLLRFVGRDGVYAFDGSIVKRLSSKWYPTFATIKQSSKGEQYKLWDSDLDFLNGDIDINLSTYSGTIGLDLEDFADGDYIANPTWTNIVGTNDWAVIGNKITPNKASAAGLYLPFNKVNGVYSFDVTMNGGFAGFRYYPIAQNTNLNLSGPGFFVSASLGTTASFLGIYKTGTTGDTLVCSTSSFSVIYSSGSTTKLIFTLSDISVGVVFGALSCSGSPGAAISSSTYTGIRNTGVSDVPSFSNFSYIYKSTGTFTSEVSTATGLSLWNIFDADDTLNGQTINYSMRTGATAAAVLNNAWQTITPGAVVSTTTNGYAQWKADFSTNDNSVTPILDSASIAWVTGDNTRSPINAVNYKSRYWMAASTQPANQYNDMVMVESKSPLATYTRYDLPLSALAIWNGNLYGAIGNTSKIARIDYGSTDDGAAIDSYWQSRDEVYENPIFYKSVNIGVLDYSNSPANTGLVVSLSDDLGVSWEDRTIDLSASTLARNTAKINYTPETALGFRTKISNNVLGLGFKVYGLHTFGEMTQYYGQ